MAEGENPQLYEDLMRFKPDELTPNAWAMKAGVSRAVWSDMRRHGNPSRRTLEKLLGAAGSSLAEFEALRIDGHHRIGEGAAGRGLAEHRGGAWGAAQLPPLSLVATTMAGEWGDPAAGIELSEIRIGELVERIARPASLATDHSAYAITIVGDSMWPRFRPGRRVAVSVKAPVAVGDDVMVKLKAPAQAVGIPVLIKELVRSSSNGVELRQFKPDLTFKVAASEIASIEKVIGELI